MSQLTSIQNLRNSSAMQSRVENVMKFLTKRNPQWQAEWFFPIAIINVSNGQDDCSWVRDHSSTHHKGDGMLYSEGASTEAAKVLANLKGFSARSEDDFAKLNELLTSAFGASVNWINGIGVGTGAAVEQVPFDASKAVEASPSGASTSSARATKPAMQANGSPVQKARKSNPKPIKTTAARPTKLDDAKKLFSDLTPKQKVDLLAWAEEKVLASKPCLAEREKLGLSA